MTLHTETRLHIRVVGDAPHFRPRWRCSDGGDLQVIVGGPRDVQRALASTSASPPRLAIVIDDGAAPRVDCAGLLVTVASLAEARRACGILVALAAPRDGDISTVDSTDLRHLVAEGQQGEGVILRRRGHTLVEAAALTTAALVGRRLRSACLGLVAADHETALHDVTDAMAMIEDHLDDDVDLVVSIRCPPPGKTAVSTVSLFGRLACAP